VERLTQRLGRLVDDLLFLARRDSGIVQPAFQSVRRLLMEVVEEQQMLAAEKNIKLSLDLVDPCQANYSASSGKNQSPRFEERRELEGDKFPSTLSPTGNQNLVHTSDWNQLVRLF